MQLRWRMASDSSVTRSGWRIDTISVNEGVFCTFELVPAGSAITAESFVPVNGVIDSGEKVSVNFTLRNKGTSATTNLVATLQATGGVLEEECRQVMQAFFAEKR